MATTMMRPRRPPMMLDIKLSISSSYRTTAITTRSMANFFAHDWHHQTFMMDDSLKAKQSWLDDLIKEYPAEVDAEAYCVILRALAASKQSGSPQQAEKLISNMLPAVKPNDACYQAVMEAWAISPREGSSLCIVRTEQWFNQIKKPTLEHYHTFLDVVTKGRNKVNNRNRANAMLHENALKAEKILRSMETSDDTAIHPDTQAYNYVIRGWSRARGDLELLSEKVMEWLTKMEKIQQKNPTGPVQPNTKSYAMGMESYALLAGERARTTPGGGSDELAQVEALLSYLQELHKAGYPNVMPNTVVYNILLSTYARLSRYNHQDAPLKAEKVLRRMMIMGENTAPDFVSFSKIILCWTNADRSTSGQRAGYWLDKLWELYKEKGQDVRLRPNIAVYNLVMKAWRHDPANVEKVFLQLLRAERKEAHLRPNTESFSCLIVAWSKHDISHAVMWLEELIKREKATATEPFSVTTTPELFHVILKRAAADPSLDNLSFGVKVFELWRESRHDIDTHGFTWLLKLGIKTLAAPHHDADRKSFVEDMIEDCCNHGLVSNVFLRELASGSIYHNGWTAAESRAFVKEYFSEWPIPAGWSRNVQVDFHAPQESDTVRKNHEILYHDLEQEEMSN